MVDMQNIVWLIKSKKCVNDFTNRLKFINMQLDFPIAAANGENLQKFHAKQIKMVYHTIIP